MLADDRFRQIWVPFTVTVMVDHTVALRLPDRSRHPQSGNLHGSAAAVDLQDRTCC